MLRFYRLQQLILALGDLALIGLATQLAPFIRLGHMLDVSRVYTAATVFTTNKTEVRDQMSDVGRQGTDIFYPFPVKPFLGKFVSLIPTDWLTCRAPRESVPIIVD